MFRALAALLIFSLPLAAADGLVGRWVLDRAAVSGAKVKPSSGEWAGEVAGEIHFSENPQALVLDGKTNFIRLGDKVDGTRLPSAAITAEAWIAPSAGGAWGAMIGCLQDNGEFERGWLLGYKDSKWCFAVSTGKKLTYMTAPEEMRLGRWAHVAGTYDGAVMRLYVDGREVATSNTQSGPIVYAPAPFVLGTYQDADENYPFDGLLREAALWSRALPAEEIARHFAEGRRQFPPGMNAAPLPMLGPYVRFTGPGSALVQWWTESESVGVVEFGETRKLGSRATEAKAETKKATEAPAYHAVELHGLKPRTTYQYRIMFPKTGGGETAGTLHELETDFNFTKAPLPDVKPYPEDALTQKARKIAEALDWRIYETAGRHRSGYVLDYGCGDGRLAWEIAKRLPAFSVVGVSTDASAIAEGRRCLEAAGVYGNRITLLHCDPRKLPFNDNNFDWVVSSDLLIHAREPGSVLEMIRVLRPGTWFKWFPAGREAALLCNDAWRAWIHPIEDRIKGADFGEGKAVATRKAPLLDCDTGGNPALYGLALSKLKPDGIGAWSHAYGDAGQSTNSGDKTVHGRTLGVQWFGEPGAHGMMDRQARNPPPLCVNGTFYIQGNNRLFALNAWNGAIQWTLEIPELRRVNIPRDSANMCADEDHLFAAVRNRAWRIGARTGDVEVSYAVPGAEPREWGFIATVGERLFGTAVKPASAYTRFEGGPEYWYDSFGPESTAKVCGDALFAFEKQTGGLAWRHAGGLIVNSTVSIGGGRIYFLESRNPALANEPNARIASAELYRDMWLVALDAESGRLVWEKKIELPAAAVPAAPVLGANVPAVLYLCYSDEKLVLLDSVWKTYHTFAFSAKDGAELWRRSHPWKRDNHGGHLYHPVIVRGMVIVEPFACDLASGEVKMSNLPERGGCSTLSAAADCLHYINWDYDKGSMYVWDLDDNRTRQFSGSRGNCWLSFISGSGMVLLPTASGGCTCRYPNQVTLGFAPR